MSNHSPIGASGAHRWMECPGSVQLSKDAPEQPQNQYAARGTKAHEILEKCFMADASLWDFEGEEYEGGEVNEEDCQAIEDSIEWLDSRRLDEDTVYQEVEFSLPQIHEKAFGTADIVMDDGKKLRVYDYKHGSGAAVEVENNVQLMYYALGAINEFRGDILHICDWGDVYEEVEIGIVQPRKGHADGPFRTWIVPPETLNAFAKELKEKAEIAMGKDAPFKAGKHCKWCKAQAICGHMYNQSMEVTKSDFTVLPTIKTLTTADISKVLEHEQAITSWLKSVKSHAQQLLERGDKVPGFKLVRKRANRKWENFLKPMDHLGSFGLDFDDVYEPLKIKSPSKIEKMLNSAQKDFIQDYITQPNNGNTIVSVTDKRQEVLATDDFEVIERSQ